MKYVSAFLMGISFLAFTCCQQKPTNEPFIELSSLELTDEEVRMADASNDFTCDFFQKTNVQQQEQNLFISPLSAQFNLGMVANGTSGKTFQELESALHLSGNNEQSANNYFLKLMNNLPRLDSTTIFQSANSIWINKESPVKTSFQQTSRKYFLAEVQNLEFSDPKSADIINQWMNEQTQGRINKVLDKTKDDCILINTLFFKGGWIFPFDESNTRQEDFYPANGEKYQVSMMHRPDTWFNYHETDLFEMATLPYGNNSYAMTVILPKTGISADSCVTAFSGTNWKAWLAASDTTSRNLDLKLPSIKLDSKTDLIPIFRKMGVNAAFNKTYADFSRMTDLEASISEIKQFTRLEITETGTVAAAATITDVCLEEEVRAVITPHPFHVNRPFLLVIHETKTGLILFMGKINEIP
ncbi:serpin family protein [uncultured Bacteroides sp.]|uniref:serpin family protein n=1 Tax=uncultured Bacteroides sp. TaxID=162156 RepID=UPI00260470CE|nr:serpin family protein [uncultured Bacteroides sp.]